MEYERKNRWANYGSSKCKEYLRNDFSYECAYCKLQEKEVGLIGADYFQIDHFQPQSDKDSNSNLDLYSNLNYSCRKCNSEKSDQYSINLLDPSKEYIYTDNKHVKGGYDEKDLYKYFAVTQKGQIYIDTFKLNSRFHIQIRKKRKQRENYIKEENKLIDKILKKISLKTDIPNKDELISLLDKVRNDKDNRVSELLRSEDFEKVSKYLNNRGIKNSIIFEEYNIDFKLKYKNKSYYCELITDKEFNSSEKKIKYIDKEKLEVWFEKLTYDNWGIIYYYSTVDKLYLFSISDNISKQDLTNIKVKKQIIITEELLIK